MDSRLEALSNPNLATLDNNRGNAFLSPADQTLLKNMLASSSQSETLLHSAISHNDKHMVSHYLSKFIEFKARGLITDNSFIEKTDQHGNTPLSVYLFFNYKTSANQLFCLTTLEYFMMAGANIDVKINAQDTPSRLLEMLAQFTPSHYLLKCLLTYGNGRKLIATYLQDLMAHLQVDRFLELQHSSKDFETSIIDPTQLVRRKIQLTTEQIFEFVQNSLTEPVLQQNLKDFIRKPESVLLRVLFNINFCNLTAHTSELCRVSELFGPVHMTAICQYWTAQRGDAFELYVNTIIKCIERSLEQYEVQFSMYTSGLRVVGNLLGKVVHNDTNELNEVTNIILSESTFIIDRPLQAKLQWIERVITHPGIADNQQGNGIWRYIIRAIHKKAYIQQIIKLEGEQHSDLCAKHNIDASAYPNNVLDVYTQKPKADEKPFFCADPTYRRFFHEYLCAWLEQQLTAFPAPNAALDAAQDQSHSPRF